MPGRAPPRSRCGTTAGSPWSPCGAAARKPAGGVGMAIRDMTKQEVEMATSPFPTRTEFTLDVLGRYICNGLDEALQSTTGRSDARPFDVIVIGGGTFGGAVAEHIWYRDAQAKRHRVLVLEAGPLMLSEHFQNTPVSGLGTSEKATSIAELRAMTPDGQRRWSKEVWGLAWHSPTPFPGLAYCLGGRSLFWGGWSPRPLASELPLPRWPQAVVDDLDNEYFADASEQIGVSETNDFIYGELHNALRQMLYDGIVGNQAAQALTLNALPDHPAVPQSTAPTKSELLELLGLTASSLNVAELRNQLKLEAPLAVQGRPPRAGFFPLNKFSTVPLLIKAARSAQLEANNDDVKKRLMIVPHCHVVRLATIRDGARWRVTGVETNQGTVPLPEHGVVIIALGTIESTRLALASWETVGLPHYHLIGKNLIGHLRSNVTIRMPRASVANLPAGVNELQASALFVKGRDTAGTQGHFHAQITAAGLEQPGADSEAELFKKVPDVDTLAAFFAADDQHVVITVRGIGEMEPADPSNIPAHPSKVALDPNRDPDEYGVPRAFVTMAPTANDQALWTAMDATCDQLAKVLSGNQPFEVMTPQGLKQVQPGDDLSTKLFYTPNGHPDPAQRGRRDGLGTTHHEAGTLWMGEDPAKSVTTPEARFHDVMNVYAAGPALFPSVGSPNPMLTGIALARRLGDHLSRAATPDPGFTLLFDGLTTAKWQMSSISNQPGRDHPGRFRVIDKALVAEPGTDLGLFWHTDPTPPNFILRLEWMRFRDDDNSGVFVRFPDPNSKGYNNTAYVAVDFGFEVQIDQTAAPDGALNHLTGAIYNFAAPSNPGTLPVRPLGMWNDYEIRVQDQTYTVSLNGVQVTSFNFVAGSDATHPDRGLPSTISDPRFIGLQTHTGGVAFRKIQIQEI